MKAWRAACVAALAWMSCACAPEETKAPCPQVSWGEAKELILSGKVESIFQTQGYIVYIRLKDGSKVVSASPKLDEVFEVIKSCGATCASIHTSLD